MADAIEDVVVLMPAAMASLTRQFIDEKGFDKRTAIRARMKALLDFVSTDNEYPDIPGPSGGAGGMQIGQNVYQDAGAFLQVGRPVRPLAVHRQEPRREPVGVLPIPGAAEPGAAEPEPLPIQGANPQ